MIEVNSIGPESFFNRIEEHHLEFPSVNTKLGYFVSCIQSPRFLDNRIAMSIVVVEFLRFDGDTLQRRQQAQIPQDQNSGRLYIDSNAQSREDRGRLKQMDVFKSVGV